MSTNHNNSNIDSSVTEDLVRHVAKLSRLSLDEESVKKFRGQLSQILGYIGQLDEIDTRDVAPTSHVLSSMKNVFREDVPKRSLTPEEALMNAPEKEKDFFKVPKII